MVMAHSTRIYNIYRYTRVYFPVNHRPRYYISVQMPASICGNNSKRYILFALSVGEMMMERARELQSNEGKGYNLDILLRRIHACI